MSLKKERGQSVVEVALLFPLLIMLLMGVVDFGRAYYTLVALSDAAGEGVTYAAIYPSDVNGIQLRTTEATEGLVEIKPEEVNVQYPAAIQAGAPITVTVEHRFTMLTPLMDDMIPDRLLTLRGKATQPVITVR